MRRLYPSILIYASTLQTSIVYAQSEPDYERAPIYYSATAPNNAVTRLQSLLTRGEIKLAGSELEMLRTLLNELGVSPASQMLVFSRTSFQRTRIHPDQPRALYFSNSVYVGWVPGGLVEVTAIDPQLGPVFYTLTLPGPQQTSPKIERESDCLRCHGGVFVREIPGLFVRSVFPDAAGDPLLRHGTQIVDDETPFAERWGGWYVTGYDGTASHRGNALASEQGEILRFKPSAARPKELSAFFDTTRYLRPTSDMLALLICEHQMSVQNSLTHAAFAVRRIIDYQHGLQTAFHEPQTDTPAFDSVRSVFSGAVQDVVDHLLFRQAAPLPAGIIADPAFVASFAPNAPRSRAGHALRDLQLTDRLFAQRCSYLIYSEVFRALPPGLKSRIYARLKTALGSRDPSDRYAYLQTDEKERILSILEETLPDFSDSKISSTLVAR